MFIKNSTCWRKYSLVVQKFFLTNFVILLFCCSCDFASHNSPQKNSEFQMDIPKIDVVQVKSYIRLLSEEIEDVVNINDCSEPLDTLFQNYPFTYQEALVEIKNAFDAIDSTSYNLATRQYIKALTLADFVFAIFSFRLLGDEDGIKNDTIVVEDWDKLTLSECYDIGNQNFAALYCGERSSFFRRLCDTLLQLPTKEQNFSSGFHIYPLVNIQGVYFLIDPYSPFLVYDKLTQLILPYDSFFSVQESHVKIERSSRMFGCSRELVSKPLLKETSKSELICDVKEYVKNMAVKQLGKLPDSTLLNEIHIPDFKTAVYVANNSRFQYALRICGRPEKDRFREVEDLRLFYDASLPGKSF